MSIYLPDDPPTVEEPVRSIFWRVHPRELDALWFGRTGQYRFDAPSGEYGVCYVGGSLGVAILETLVRGKRVPIIPRTQLEKRAGSQVVPTEPLRLLQLEGEGLPAFGLSVHQVTGPDYSECRDLALRVWNRFPDLDGIRYRSRWDNSLCCALFDRASAKVAVVQESWLGDPSVVTPALRPYRHVSVT